MYKEFDVGKYNEILTMKNSPSRCTLYILAIFYKQNLPKHINVTHSSST